MTSSSGDKTYSVRWSDDFRQISSNDNASYWQGYCRCPIIAIVLALGRISFDANAAKPLVGVHWKKVNGRHKRDCDKAVDSVLQEVESGGDDRAAIVNAVERICKELAALKLSRGSMKNATQMQ